MSIANFKKLLSLYCNEYKKNQIHNKQIKIKNKLEKSKRKKKIHIYTSKSINRELTADEINYLKTHSVKESIDFLNLSRSIILKKRKKYNIKIISHTIKRIAHPRKLSGRSKHEILIERYNTHSIMVYNEKIFYIKNDKVNEYKMKGYMLLDDYMKNKYLILLSKILEVGLNNAIKFTNYKGKPNIKNIIALAIKHLGREIINKDYIKKIYKKCNIIFHDKKPYNRTPFSQEEDAYILTHQYKDSANKFNRSMSAIKKHKMKLKFCSV